MLQLPSFCTIALMPYLYSIDKALIAGLLMHTLLVTMEWLWPADKREGELMA